MSGNPKFALVVPTLNEEANIGALLKRVIAVLMRTDWVWEIIVVDDSSTDRTGDFVEEFALSNSRVRLVSRKGKRGLAGAITHGWSCTDAALLGVIDADLQHPPEVIIADS